MFLATRLKLKKFSDFFNQYKSQKIYAIALFNILLILGQSVYIRLRFSFLNEQIPFWQTMPWGDPQLAQKDAIFMIPIMSSLVLIAGIILYFLLNRFFFRYLADVVGWFISVTNIMLSYAVYYIVVSASGIFDSLINPLYVSLLLPFLVAFCLVYFLLPYFIDFVKVKDIITDPEIHSHPGMILTKPSARAGGAFFAVIFVLVSVFFVGFSQQLMGFYAAILMLGILGYVDDFQNTHPTSTFKILENPLLRLLLIFAAVSLIIMSGIRIGFIGNPLGGFINFDTFIVTLGNSQIPLLSIIFTLVWVAWILNLLSWSNGIDGQYAGIIGIASVIVAVLALRFVPLEPIHKQSAVLAAICAGAAFGFTKYTWYPSKIMWGFGALSAGLVIATISILIKGKIVLSVLLILVPFLDGVVTAGRRILQGKSPLKGDRGHLHHLLLERGWSAPKIAAFYWGTTILFGLIGLLSSEKYLLQVGLMVVGLVGFFIVLLNLKSIKGKKSRL